MTWPDSTGWAILAITALVGSTVGGVAGLGAGIIMIPSLGWVLGVKAVVPVLTVAMLLGNLSRMWFSRTEVDGRVVAAFLAGAIPAGIVGALLYTRVESQWVGRLIGAFMMSAVPVRRWLQHHEIRVRLGQFPLIGAGIGFLSSLVASVGPVSSPFFLGYGLRKGAYLGTEALCAVGMHLTRGLVFRRYDLLSGEAMLVGALIGGLMVGGAWAGRRLVDRLSERQFLRVIEALLIGLGIQFLVWPPR
ncbi:MAG: sulfite exporter TauE/SafE family protein [Candidatus Rokubacteria bacterium]|nr:sulfite exporter TauE/SafE family protein [Candidatus Rokubacteria bacterium]